MGDGRVVVNNVWDGLDSTTNIGTGGFSWTTYPERLEEAGVSWMVYQNIPNNYGCNPLLGFKNFRKANEASAKPVSTSLPQGASPAYAPGDDAGNPLYKGTANTCLLYTSPSPRDS